MIGCRLRRVTRNVARSYPIVIFYKPLAADPAGFAVRRGLSAMPFDSRTDSDRSTTALGLRELLEDPGAAFTGACSVLRQRQNERAVKKPGRATCCEIETAGLPVLPPLVLRRGA